MAQLNEGTQAEVDLIGREGMVGLALMGGVETAFAETYMQSGGSGLQMEASAFQRELDENSELLRQLFRYNEAMHAQTAQTAACNGCHELEQRLARSAVARAACAEHPAVEVWELARRVERVEAHTHCR